MREIEVAFKKGNRGNMKPYLFNLKQEDWKHKGFSWIFKYTFIFVRTKYVRTYIRTERFYRLRVK